MNKKVRHGDCDQREHDLSLVHARTMFSKVMCCGIQDTETLQATIQLMAQHTSQLTQSQQARLVAAVGAAGAAQQLSDLTLKGTASLLPSAAMLAGILARICICSRNLHMCMER
jgi:hypothetical protein